MSKDGIAALYLYKKSTEFLPSIFDISPPQADSLLNQNPEPINFFDCKGENDE
jgi:hypothetical protein